MTPFYPLGSLDTWIRDHGPLAVEDVLQIGVKIAGALESAHRLGVVHRDVKPGNILLTDYGEPALTDFGIAHIAGGFRTAAAVPGFELDESNKGAVAQICARLDGLPLDIELAAARLRTMTPQQILERIDIRNPVLTRASRTAPIRQQTLRLCMDSSHGLCTPAEQQLWAQSRYSLEAANWTPRRVSAI